MYKKAIDFLVLVSQVRALSIKRKINNKDAKVRIISPNFKLRIKKGKNSKFIVNGQINLQRFRKSTTMTNIIIDENAILEINGDFTLGSGLWIHVLKNVVLKIGGNGIEKNSGITSDTSIIVYKHIELGKDFVCAWGCFISDSDWHYIEYNGQPTEIHKDVIIGNHVWIAHNCSILKGVTIGDDCVVGCNSMLRNKVYPKNSLIAGSPGKVVKAGCKWRSDIPYP